LNELKESDAIVSSLPAPLVSVGIPTFNRPDGLRRTLECITRQSYRNLEIIISDNCSPGPETQSVAEEFQKNDSRIQYFRQDKNQGPAWNFAFVLEKATGEYFMWASDDDEWDKNFIKSLIFLLENNKKIGMAFCNIVSIDSYSRIIRELPSFEVFSGVTSHDTIANYLKSPEFFGKANLIYSLYRLDICKEALKACPFTDHWGSDMCFVLGALVRGGICIDKRVLFKKRYARETDIPDHADMVIARNPVFYSFDFLCTFTYITDNLKAVQGTPYYFFTLAILIGRIPKSFVIFCLNQFHNILRNIIKQA